MKEYYMNKNKKYKSPFTSDIIINSPQEACQIIMSFCNNCKKNAIDQYHCSGRDSAICDAIKNQIIKDWSKNNI